MTTQQLLRHINNQEFIANSMKYISSGCELNDIADIAERAEQYGVLNEWLDKLWTVLAK